LKTIIQLGPDEWTRKQQALMNFHETSSGGEIIERIQPAHVRA
jgi:hypothetical protein